MKLTYPACFYPCEEKQGGYTVEVPDLPGCVSEGDSLADAILMATDAACGWVLDELEDGKPVPASSSLNDIVPDEGGFISLLALDIDAYSEKYVSKSVRRHIKKKSLYPALFHKAEEGGFWISFPDLPECLTQGDDMTEAYEMAVDALGLALESREKEHDIIPEASDPTTIVPEQDSFIVVVEFDMLAYKKRTGSRAVKKTLSIPGCLNMNDFMAMLEDQLDDSDISFSDLSTLVSLKITEARMKMNMNQKQFAEYLGVSQSMVSRWESECYNFTLKTICEILDKLEPVYK